MFPLFSLLNVFDDWALLLLRLAVGAVLIAHGVPKLKNMKQTRENFTMMGFKPGNLWAPVVAIVESLGGLFLVLGVYTGVAAFVLTIEFLVILFWRIGKRQPFVGGWELDALIFTVLLVLLTVGGGNFNLNGVLSSLFY